MGLINEKPYPFLNRQELQQKQEEQNKNKQTQQQNNTPIPPQQQQTKTVTGRDALMDDIKKGVTLKPTKAQQNLMDTPDKKNIPKMLNELLKFTNNTDISANVSAKKQEIEKALDNLKGNKELKIPLENFEIRVKVNSREQADRIRAVLEKEQANFTMKKAEISSSQINVPVPKDKQGQRSR